VLFLKGPYWEVAGERIAREHAAPVRRRELLDLVLFLAVALAIVVTLPQRYGYGYLVVPSAVWLVALVQILNRLRRNGMRPRRPSTSHI